MADVIRAELLEIIKRIELPYAEPAFGSKENTLNIKKALLSGYFMQVSAGEAAFRVGCSELHLGRTFCQTFTEEDYFTDVHINMKLKALRCSFSICIRLPTRPGPAR